MERYLIPPGTEVDLSQWDPNDSSLFEGGKDLAKARIKELRKETAAMQRLLFAERKHKVLMVLQAMDTGGKDGTIRNVFRGVNPQGVSVTGFKVPSDEELAHDYLWRVHDHAPAAGRIAVFNRSHYEDVLVVRVHRLVPEEVWSHRYQHINQFERMLADEGTTILKFYLHIDPDEQKQRLQDRLIEPESQWKFRRGDLKERQLWAEYISAYEAALAKTSTEWAPWYVVPANRKWYRNIVVSTILNETLRGLDMQWPEPEDDLDGIIID